MRQFSHCFCTGEQRGMDACPQFAFFFSVIVAPQSIEWYHPHSGMIFFLQPNLETHSQTCSQVCLGNSRCCQVDRINHCSPHIKGDFSLLFLSLGGRWVFSVHASFSPWGAILAVSFVNLFLYIPYPLHWLQGMCLSWIMDKMAPFSPPSNSAS